MNKLFKYIFIICFILILVKPITATIFCFISIGYFILNYLNNKQENSILSGLLFFYFCSHLIGATHSKFIEDMYDEYGWRAIGKFDFSISSYLNIYTIISLNFILLFTIIILFNKYISRVRHNNFYIKHDSNIVNFNKTKFRLSGSLGSGLIISFLILSLFISIISFDYGIGLHGGEEVLLPYKLTGIIIIVRGYLIPAIILFIYSTIKPKFYLNLFIILIGVLIGIYSGSKGVALFYILPVIMFLIKAKSNKKKILAFLLFIIAFQSASYSQALFSLFPGMSSFQHLNVMLSFSQNVSGNEFDLLFYLEQIVGIVHRFYGFQDAVLGSQYKLTPNLSNLINYFYSGSPSIIMPNVTSELFGLQFPDGMQIGVAIGWIGIGTYLYVQNKIIWILFIFISGLILFIISDLLNRSFKKNSIFKQAISLMIAVIFLSADISVLYRVIFILLIYTFILKTYINKYQKK